MRVDRRVGRGRGCASLDFAGDEGVLLLLAERGISTCSIDHNHGIKIAQSGQLDLSSLNSRHQVLIPERAGLAVNYNRWR